MKHKIQTTKKLVLTLIFIFSITFIHSQDAGFAWVKHLFITGSGYELRINGLATDSVGNIYIAGKYGGNPDFDPGPGVFNFSTLGYMFIAKLTSSGNFVWAKQFAGSASNNSIISLFLDKKGNIYTAGSMQGTVDFDPGTGTYNLVNTNSSPNGFISKLDANGNFIWAKKFSSAISFNGSDIESMTEEANGIFLVSGTFYGTVNFNPNSGTYNLTSAASKDLFVAKFDSSGSIIWAKAFSGGIQKSARTIAVDAAKNIYISGYFYGTTDFDPGSGTYTITATGNRIYIVKLDSNGNFIWVKNVEGGDNYLNSLKLDANANIYAIGEFTGTVDFDPGTSSYNLIASSTYADVFIWKLDSAGNFIWAKQIKGFYTSGVSIALDTSNNVYCNGYFKGTSDFNPSVGIADTFNLTSQGNSDGYIFKLNNTGNFIWAKQIAGSYNVNFTTLLITKSLEILSAGVFRGQVDFDPGSTTHNILSSTSNNDGFIHKMTACNPSTSNLTINICNRYFLNDEMYNTSGTYTQMLKNAKGCDSTIILNLTIQYPSTSIIADTSCDSLLINGITYFNTGTYKQVLTNAKGCDSTITINLIINKSTIKNLTITACDTFKLNNISYTSSGIYVLSYLSKSGCDSTINLFLTIKNSSKSILNITSCNSYKIYNQSFTTSGVYIQKISNSVLCDSIITINLTILKSTSSLISISACNNYSLNNINYSSSGVYIQNLTNAAGCDSSITLNLTIKKSSTFQISDSACKSYTLNGKVYTASGIYTQTLINAVGCDSQLVLNLKIKTSTSSFFTASSCDSYFFNNKTYTGSGIYYETIANNIGCDSFITLFLTITSIDKTVTQNGMSLRANMYGATYQWFNCLTKVPLSGETSQNFMVSSNGEYAVIVTKNNCTDTSVCYNYSGIGINEKHKSRSISLFPNPTSGEIIIKSIEGFNNASFVLTDAFGRVILELKNQTMDEINFNITEQASGLYFLKITEGTQISQFKLIKN